MTLRKVIWGSAALAAAVLAYCLTPLFLPADSLATVLVSDFGLVVVEITTMVLGIMAYLRAMDAADRWLWVVITLWLGANLFGDASWTYYNLRGISEVPMPSLADVGYLLAYPLAFATVVLGARRVTGRLRSVEASLDALMFTVGLACITWPLILEPLLRTAAPGLGYWVTLAYPIGDLLVILSFISLMLNAFNSRLPKYLVVIFASFVVQVVADSGYFATLANGGTYEYGKWLDGLWTAAIALGGVAALVGMYSRSTKESPRVDRELEPDRPAAGENPVTWTKLLLPYLALPIAAAMIALQLFTDGPHWNLKMQGLSYLGIGLVFLLIVRQHITLLQNRRLTGDLSTLSEELSRRVDQLASFTCSLRALNEHANRLNTLQSLPEVTADGVRLACWATEARMGWLVLDEEQGERVAARWRDGECVAVGAHEPDPAPGPGETLRTVTLEARGNTLGRIHLVCPDQEGSGPNLVHAMAAHLATAIDNICRYERAMHLAQMDPLTGLLNHRSVYTQLEDECRRVDRHGGNVSVIMVDLDDFKLLNDTYGHPVGDQVLIQVTHTIRTILRQTDVAGRIGGDELMLVLPETAGKGALGLSERLRQKLVATPFVTPGGQAIPLRLSLGVGSYPADADSLAKLVEVADANLYVSKQRGGNAITGCDGPAGDEKQAEGLLGVAGRLLDAVGTRDHYTRRHSEKVVTYALILGEAVGLTEDSLHTLRLAAMLHDVGKVGVPVRVLRKPSALDPDETDAVRQHVDLGESIIQDIPRIAAVLEAVKAHHERIDGFGYPRGVVGDDIPHLAKILAVADAYAAMTVDRPYRRGMDHEEARAELLRVAGSQLDPELVLEFVETLAPNTLTPVAPAG